jgi:hypothetical protein
MKNGTELLGEYVYYVDKGDFKIKNSRVDEVIAYHTLNTGSDRHGRFMPVKYKYLLSDCRKEHYLRDQIFESKEELISKI